MKDPDYAWQRLAAAARRADAEQSADAPFGFATRIAAQAMAIDRPSVSILERLSLRAMGIACLLAIVAVAANYRGISHLFSDDAPSDDPIAELVDIAS